MCEFLAIACEAPKLDPFWQSFFAGVSGFFAAGLAVLLIYGIAHTLRSLYLEAIDDAERRGYHQAEKELEAEKVAAIERAKRRR